MNLIMILDFFCFIIDITNLNIIIISRFIDDILIAMERFK